MYISSLNAVFLFNTVFLSTSDSIISSPGLDGANLLLSIKQEKSSDDNDSTSGPVETENPNPDSTPNNNRCVAIPSSSSCLLQVLFMFIFLITMLPVASQIIEQTRTAFKIILSKLIVSRILLNKTHS